MIFDSYVNLPEGTRKRMVSQPTRSVSPLKFHSNVGMEASKDATPWLFLAPMEQHLVVKHDPNQGRMIQFKPTHHVFQIVYCLFEQ